MKNNSRLIIILFIIGLLGACSKTPNDIKCYPKDATGCTGWAGNESIF